MTTDINNQTQQQQQPQQHLQRISLHGEWELSGYAGNAADGEAARVLTATVPGCVHMDLEAHGLIPDLHYRDNETKMYWVYQQDWSYQRQFEMTEAAAHATTVTLRCLGVDTLATIYVNDQKVAMCDNMNRTWDIDLTGAVQAGTNTIRFEFPSILPYLKEQHEKKETHGWNISREEFNGRSGLRKMACSYGWDWGPVAPSVGIWRDIDILYSSEAQLECVSLRQEHSTNKVVVSCDAPVKCAAETTDTDTLYADLVLSFNGETVAKNQAAVVAGHAQIQVAVENPSLWWPRDLGEQSLYDCTITLRTAEDVICDVQHKRIGLRTLELIRDESVAVAVDGEDSVDAESAGQSFTFRVNGRDIFAKGANWIPMHNYLPSISDEDYRSRLQDAADAHMNMIRVWGGGIYEDDIFYDLCDEMGLMVWQDFMFACSGYPFGDDELCANVTEEFRDNVKRMRHHPSIALWCGNNEIEQGLVGAEWTAKTMGWEDYKRVFDVILPDVCGTLDSDRPYWPGSPHTPINDRNKANDERSGDCHLWNVWFGGEPFEAQRGWTCRFMSEFGFQSFPEPKTLRGFTEEKDRNLSSYVMDFHQRSMMGNKTIYAYLMDWFLLPKNLDETLWLSQVSQGLCVKYATEHLRRLQPHNMGVLYWQINDIWPCASWSSIDYHGRWKALQYMAKQFFAPMLVTVLEDSTDWSFELHVSNQEIAAIDVQLHWSLTDTSGQVIRTGSTDVAVESQSNVRGHTLDCSDLKDRYQDRDILCWVWIEHDGVVVSRNCAHLCKPKYLHLQEPTISTRYEQMANGHLALTLSSDVPALWARVTCEEHDIRWSDNFINLDGSNTVRIESAHSVNISNPEAAIVVSSLYHSAWD